VESPEPRPLDCRGLPGGPSEPIYARHRPEETLLHQVVREQLEAFLARARDREHPVPRFVALASRAFAFYYMLQCLVAISVSKSPVQRAGMAVVAAVLGFITVFAVPAS
jgi:hypothetical protein